MPKRPSARGERVGGSLSDEQQQALELVTGRGGVTVLVGEAGTGKGVVLGAAREAWERDGHRVIGTAVAGAAAQRLGTDAGIRETMTADALAHRVHEERLVLDSRSVVVFDEAGMADTRRLAQVVELTRRGGREARPRRAIRRSCRRSARAACSARSPERAPTARLTEVHRANHEWERDAWGRLREGDAAGRARRLPGPRPPAPRGDPRGGGGEDGQRLGRSSVRRIRGSAW